LFLETICTLIRPIRRPATSFSIRRIRLHDQFIISLVGSTSVEHHLRMKTNLASKTICFSPSNRNFS
jgi:hypothetical protein